MDAVAAAEAAVTTSAATAKNATQQLLESRGKLADEEEKEDRLTTGLSKLETEMDSALQEGEARSTAEKDALETQKEDLSRSLSQVTTAQEKLASDIEAQEAQLRQKQVTLHAAAAQENLDSHTTVQADEQTVQKDKRMAADVSQQVKQTEAKIERMQLMESKAAQESSEKEVQSEQSIKDVAEKIETLSQQVTDAEHKQHESAEMLSIAQTALATRRKAVQSIKDKQSGLASERQILEQNSKNLEARREKQEEKEQAVAKARIDKQQAVCDEAKSEHAQAVHAFEKASVEAAADSTTVSKQNAVEVAKVMRDSAAVKESNAGKHLQALENVLHLLVIKADARKQAVSESRQETQEGQKAEDVKAAQVLKSAEQQLQEALSAVHESEAAEHQASESVKQTKTQLDALKEQRKQLQQQQPTDNTDSMLLRQIDDAKKELLGEQAKERSVEAEVGAAEQALHDAQAKHEDEDMQGQQQLNPMKNKLAALKTLQVEKQEEKSSLTEQLQHKEQEIQTLQARQEQDENSIHTLKSDEINATKVELEQQRAKVAVLKTVVSKDQAEQETHDRAYQKLKQKQVELSAHSIIQSSAVKVALDEKMKEKSDANQKLSQMSSDVTSADDEVTEILTKIEREQIKAASQKKVLLNIDGEIAPLQANIDNVTQSTAATLENDRAQLARIQSQYHGQSEKVQETIVKVNATQAKVAMLKKKQGFAEKALARAEAKHSSMLKDAMHLRTREKQVGSEMEDMSDLLDMKTRVASSALDDLTAAKEEMKDHTAEFDEKKAPWLKEQNEMKDSIKAAEEDVVQKTAGLKEWQQRTATMKREAKRHKEAVEEAEFTQQMANQMAPDSEDSSAVVR